jgi:hypothetical protein
VNPLDGPQTSPHADVWSAMRSSFHGEEARFSASDGVALLLFVLALAVGFWMLSRVLARQDRRRRPYNNPRRLFRELARVHGLNRAERGLLADLASSRGIQPAARIFVEPLAFDTSALNARLQRRVDQIAELQRRLFAATEGVEQPARSVVG